jgi:deoxyribodipyrimidine photo-lyase
VSGTDTRPYRRFNPIRQVPRSDPRGDCVRRYIPELSTVEGVGVPEPWRLTGVKYPEPMRGQADAPWLRAA